MWLTEFANFCRILPCVSPANSRLAEAKSARREWSKARRETWSDRSKDGHLRVWNGIPIALIILTVS